jgi:hypothetical protein
MGAKRLVRHAPSDGCWPSDRISMEKSASPGRVDEARIGLALRDCWRRSAMRDKIHHGLAGLDELHARGIVPAATWRVQRAAWLRTGLCAIERRRCDRGVGRARSRSVSPASDGHAINVCRASICTRRGLGTRACALRHILIVRPSVGARKTTCSTLAGALCPPIGLYRHSDAMSWRVLNAFDAGESRSVAHSVPTRHTGERFQTVSPM